MPRVKKEEEQEVDVGVVNEEKKKTFASSWFDTHAVNNKRELKLVCDLTAKSVADQFHMVVRSNNTEVYGVIFYATFISILEYIKKKQKSYSKYTIQIANSINVGYINNEDEDNEKVGNYFPIMEYVSTNRSIVNDDSDSYTGDVTATNFIRWKQLNTTKQVEAIKEIQNNAFQKLQQEFRTSLRTEEAVIPVFSIFLDNLCGVAKELYKQSMETGVSEIKINVFGLFDLYYSYDEDKEQEVYEYTPSVGFKLILKDDTSAGGDITI